MLLPLSEVPSSQASIAYTLTLPDATTLEVAEGQAVTFATPVTGDIGVDINRFMRRLKVKAGLPEDFRPLHSLRHTFASYLASSGQVSMYELQKLLTHESPQMTQRYAHLHDEALQRASGAIEVMFDKARRADAETTSLDNITQG